MRRAKESGGGGSVVMLLYSLGLALAAMVSAPWWLFRMATTERYREGLRERLGAVPEALREAVRGRQVVWLRAVSVGEVLAASRLVVELEAALGDGWRVVISTTTRTGQALARDRFGAERVFYFPLDFAWAVRRYLRALQPKALVLMESELWPRMLYECERGGIPVVVVNARVSDRSFSRGTRMRVAWGRALRKVSLWLAQSEGRCAQAGGDGGSRGECTGGGNLKYDVRAPKENAVAAQIKEWAGERVIIVAGSTCPITKERLEYPEEQSILEACYDFIREENRALLVIAPRHPERFEEVERDVLIFWYRRASGQPAQNPEEEHAVEVVLLDTIGDLAAVYAVADLAFVGGSLVSRGGHNPLEPAQFGVPVVMGDSCENFREIVGQMRAADGIRITTETKLKTTLRDLLDHPKSAKAMGERGRKVFEAQQGATGRAVEAIVEMVQR